jgi:hypothetical protein
MHFRTRLTLFLTLFAAVSLLAVAGCSGEPVTVLEVNPRGVPDEVVSWETTAQSKGPVHLVRVGYDTDPARLMGWSRTDVGYNALLDVSVTGPEGTVSETLLMPLTEKRQVGQEGNTMLMAFGAAGIMQETGFRRVASVDAVRFKPVPGDHRIDVRLRVHTGGNRKSLKVLRTLRVEVVTRPDADGALTTWRERPDLQ